MRTGRRPVLQGQERDWPGGRGGGRQGPQARAAAPGWLAEQVRERVEQCRYWMIAS